MALKHSLVLLCSCYDKPALVANNTALIAPHQHVHLFYRAGPNDDHEDTLHSRFQLPCSHLSQTSISFFTYRRVISELSPLTFNVRYDHRAVRTSEASSLTH